MGLPMLKNLPKLSLGRGNVSGFHIITDCILFSPDFLPTSSSHSYQNNVYFVGNLKQNL
jgi:hypothetical protein